MRLPMSKNKERATSTARFRVAVQFREAWYRYLATKRSRHEQEEVFEHYLNRLTVGFVQRERVKTS